MKPHKGKIDGWYIVPWGDSRVICGVQDGHFIRTSVIVHLNAGTVETLNSVYTLGEPKGEYKS